ncbi:hypothetical protein SEA_BONUM_78 [Gordonia phage Bonum]|uniref:Uncharacterized protein n=1 Tax=Gordonia phage Kabluna TaxID=2041511 RepID=A0A2D1GCL7_9CAUD|nr:hypothetical protein KNT75_gp77 [Gordonia phage Kabluna]ATN89598.1 hypothetical protein SEA_KABLUNA_77 [Gordonia phage Kabluna]QXN73383.1 hypothetical protein SEA_BONUM_78 [Gordonia phage Bonum]
MDNPEPRDFLVAVEQTTITTFSVTATSEEEALKNHLDGVPQHSESNLSAPYIVGTEPR